MERDPSKKNIRGKQIGPSGKKIFELPPPKVCSLASRWSRTPRQGRAEQPACSSISVFSIHAHLHVLDKESRRLAVAGVVEKGEFRLGKGP